MQEMEAERRKREDDRINTIANYEQTVSQLNSEITFLKSQLQGEAFKEFGSINVLKEENEILNSEIGSFKGIKATLEEQIKKLKIERQDGQDSTSGKIRVLEADNQEFAQKLR